MAEKTTTEFIAFHKFPKITDPLIPANHEIVKGYTVDQLKKAFNITDKELERFTTPIYEEVLWVDDTVRDNMVSYPQRRLIDRHGKFPTFLTTKEYIKRSWLPFERPEQTKLDEDAQKELDEIVKEYDLK